MATDVSELLAIETIDDQVEWLNILVYGDPGVGKTYFGGTAEDHPDLAPMLAVNIEGGLTTLRHRKGLHTKTVRSMKELENLYNTLYHSISDGKIKYKTLMLDSLTELADLDMRDIMKEAFSRNPDKVDKDVPSQREWGKSRAHIRTIVRAFRDLPCHVIYTAHVGTEQNEGQPMKYFPGFSGKLRTEVPGFMDIVGYMSVQNKGGGPARFLQVQGTNRVVAKDRTAALGDVVEDPSLPLIWEKIMGNGESK